MPAAPERDDLRLVRGRHREACGEDPGRPHCPCRPHGGQGGGPVQCCARQASFFYSTFIYFDYP